MFPGLKWWRRYVDDIFILHDLTDRGFAQMLKKLNSINNRIQFTVETEIQKRLPFLDVLIECQNNGFFFDIYRKPTVCSRYIDGFSAHPVSHKLAFINSSIQRFFRFKLNEEKTLNKLNFLRKCCLENHLEPNNVNCIFQRIKNDLQTKLVTTL